MLTQNALMPDGHSIVLTMTRQYNILVEQVTGFPEDVCDIGVGLNLVEFGGFNERADDSLGMLACITA